jgi:hypothetical protein
MGSSSSRRRKGRNKPQHLPKVGTPENRAWEHETHHEQDFGSGVWVMVIAGLFVIAVIGLLVLTL